MLDLIVDHQHILGPGDRMLEILRSQHALFVVFLNAAERKHPEV